MAAPTQSHLCRDVVGDLVLIADAYGAPPAVTEACRQLVDDTAGQASDGATHRARVTSLAAAAQHLYTSGRCGPADALRERALRAASVLGRDHVVARVLHDLALVYAADGREEEAQSLWACARELCREPAMTASA